MFNCCPTVLCCKATAPNLFLSVARRSIFQVPVVQQVGELEAFFQHAFVRTFTRTTPSPCYFHHEHQKNSHDAAEQGIKCMHPHGRTPF